jgi:hypothetical protein
MREKLPVAIRNVMKKLSYSQVRIQYEYDVRMWLRMYEYYMMMLSEGVKFNGHTELKKGMTLKRFKKVWCDKRDMLRKLYDRMLKMKMKDGICNGINKK